MKNLCILTGILFTLFAPNCISMNNDKQQSIIKYWSDDIEIQKIQKLIHNNYNNDKFEIIRQPIRIDKLAEIIISFLNEEEPEEGYIIIGLEEYCYRYRKMSEIDFDTLQNKKDGIYRITTNNNIIKYYQVIDDKASEIFLKSKLRNFFGKKLFKMKDDTDLTFRECSNMFNGVIGKSILVDSNKIIPIDTPIKIGVNTDSNKPHRIVSFKDNKSYIQAVKKYVSNNTDPKIKSDDPCIEDIYIKPDGQNEIIILKIKSYKTSILQLKDTGKYYGRAQNYGSEIMDSRRSTKILMKRYLSSSKN